MRALDMKTKFDVISLILFLVGLVLAVIAGTRFTDVDSKAVKNAYGVISLVLFLTGLALAVIAEVMFPEKG